MVTVEKQTNYTMRWVAGIIILTQSSGNPAMNVLLIERRGACKTITLNRPERANSLNSALVQAIRDELRESAMDGTRVLVIRGAGNSFSSGFDLSDLESSSDDEVGKRIVDVELMLQGIYHAPFLTVALAQSKAFGAGADIVCSCHVRIAEAETQFCMPGLNFGILLGTRRLVQRVGMDEAIGLLINTRVFDAPQALQIGFLTAVADRSQWANHVHKAVEAGSAIDGKHVSRMLEVAVPDTTKQDMTDLKRSIEQPGLIERIVAYRDSIRTRSGKS